MLALSSTYSVGAEQLYPGSDSESDYLDDRDDLKKASVDYDVFYQTRAAYEISGFYSDEDEDDTHSLSPQPYLSSMHDRESPCPSDHTSLSSSQYDIQPSKPLGCQTTRKRSLTNFFHVRPETSAASNHSSSNHARSSSNFDTVPHESITNSIPENSLKDWAGPSDSYLKVLNLGASATSLGREAPKIYLARPSYLSQARGKLLNKSISRRITVGFQPRATHMSVYEQNEYFQKIWMHQQNRIESHQRNVCKFDLIPEEEEA